MQDRRRARISALQALYELDTSGHAVGDVLAYRLEDNPLPPEAEQLLRELVTGVLRHRDRLDELIRKYAPAWPVAQIAVVDRNLLRMALFELSGATDTPPKVAINEAVDLAKSFGSANSSRFVNGVLGAAVAEQKQVDLGPPAPKPDTAKD